MSQILNRVSSFNTRDEKIAWLRSNWSPAFGQLLKYAFDPKIKWTLPEGAPPFEEMKDYDNPTGLYAEVRRLYLFIEGLAPPMKAAKREDLFKGVLEFIEKDDATLLIAVKDKTPLADGVNRKLIDDAYPGLLGPMSVEFDPT